MSDALFHAAIYTYKRKFKDVPTVANLPPEYYDEATKVLIEAITLNQPLTDEEFYERLGMEPPEDGAVI